MRLKSIMELIHYQVVNEKRLHFTKYIKKLLSLCEMISLSYVNEIPFLTLARINLIKQLELIF